MSRTFGLPEGATHREGDAGVGMGERHVVNLSNGYGASIVRGLYSYGGSEGLWELGVLGPEGRLTYATPITNDVLGWLTDEMVTDVLQRIADLPTASRS